MELSIVATLYYSKSYIVEFYERVVKEAQSNFTSYEIIFVNDGSPDESLECAIELHNRDPEHVKVIDLSKNFGHHKAMMTGLMQTCGDLVFLIDVDLEEDPHLLNDFHAIMNNDKDIDVVYGIQKTRKGGWVERKSGELFYKIFNYLSDVDIPTNLITARLMKKEYVDALVQHTEQEIFLAGIWVSVGFNQVGIPVKKENHSPTTYSFSKKMSLLFNSLTSFSSKPLKLIFNIGFSITLFSFLFVIYLIYLKFYQHVGVSGWTSILASMWLLGGITIFSIGIVAVYISKIFVEVKNRPYSIIKNVYVKDDNEKNS